jgi:ubiquinone/menaquinone biosynthesis C-methylase UbiE
MTNETGQQQALNDFARAMKSDWNARARENAKWFINTWKLEQPDEEFFETARPDIESLILADLPRLTQGRDPKALRVLEIGCGIGRMTRYLADIFGEVHACDVSGEMVAQARERLRGFKNVTAHETSGVDFAALPDSYFDVAFSAYVFQHVPSKDVVRSNIREAYRLLRPGGVFKFQVNSVVNREFDETPKDTWTGVTFTETELREAARSCGAQLVSLAGLGTQYTWTVFRKRAAGAAANLNAANISPRIVGLNFNDSDAPPGQWGSYNLRETYLTACVAGVAGLGVDANQISLLVADRELEPCFVADVSGDHESAEECGVRAGAEPLTLVHVQMPRDVLGGDAELRVRLKLEMFSPPFAAALPPPRRVPPRIHLITNGADGAVDVYAEGPKAKVRLLTEGLDEGVTRDELIVRVGGWEAHPAEIEYVPSNGLHYVNTHLPAGTRPGETRAQVSYRGLWSDAAPLKIL